jgi:hypothetical protein
VPLAFTFSRIATEIVGSLPRRDPARLELTVPP